MSILNYFAFTGSIYSQIVQLPPRVLIGKYYSSCMFNALNEFKLGKTTIAAAEAFFLEKIKVRPRSYQSYPLRRPVHTTCVPKVIHSLLGESYLL